jgi:hypothetical protein
VPNLARRHRATPLIAAAVLVALLAPGLSGTRAATSAAPAPAAKSASAGTSAPPAKSAAPAAPARQRSSLQGLPGYVPLVDPESMSVVLGRRTNAPLVRQPFRGGARSLNELGRTATRYLHRSERDSLLALCVSQEEFSGILWREFPQSRPVTGLKWEDAWPVLYARLRSGCGQALGDYGGEHYEFLRFERLARADSVVRYRNFTLHNGLFMVVRNPAGQVERWNWLRSVAERKGVFKIYSTTD